MLYAFSTLISVLILTAQFGWILTTNEANQIETKIDKGSDKKATSPLNDQRYALKIQHAQANIPFSINTHNPYGKSRYQRLTPQVRASPVQSNVIEIPLKSNTESSESNIELINNDSANDLKQKTDGMISCSENPEIQPTIQSLTGLLKYLNTILESLTGVNYLRDDIPDEEEEGNFVKTENNILTVDGTTNEVKLTRESYLFDDDEEDLKEVKQSVTVMKGDKLDIVEKSAIVSQDKGIHYDQTVIEVEKPDCSDSDKKIDEYDSNNSNDEASKRLSSEKINIRESSSKDGVPPNKKEEIQNSTSGRSSDQFVTLTPLNPPDIKEPPNNGYSTSGRSTDQLVTQNDSAEESQSLRDRLNKLKSIPIQKPMRSIRSR